MSAGTEAATRTVLAAMIYPFRRGLWRFTDVFDALISQRVYKPPLPFEEARQIIASWDAEAILIPMSPMRFSPNSKRLWPSPASMGRKASTGDRDLMESREWPLLTLSSRLSGTMYTLGHGATTLNSWDYRWMPARCRGSASGGRPDGEQNPE